MTEALQREHDTREELVRELRSKSSLLERAEAKAVALTKEIEVSNAEKRAAAAAASALRDEAARCRRS